MTKSATFETDKWRFTGSCMLTAGAPFTHLYATTPFASTSGTTTNGGNWTITGTGGNFVLEVSYLPGGNYPGENDTVEFFVNVEGDVTQDFTLQLTVSNGQADSGENYVSVTNDNNNPRWRQGSVANHKGSAQYAGNNNERLKGKKRMGSFLLRL
jgi:hypothetical protein